MKVLVVEDNDILRENIKTYLEIKWFKVETNNTYEWTILKVVEFNPDVIILDLWLWSSNWDWIDICKNLRSKWNSVPILILTARTLTKQKILWLDSWADDYLTKPFDYLELIARIEALNRRNQKLKWNIINISDIKIDINKNTLEKEWELIHLSKLEFSLITYLSKNKWRVIKKEELLEKVWWEYDDFEQSRTVDIYIWYLRKKLWADLIKTIRWVWYMLP